MNEKEEGSKEEPKTENVEKKEKEEEAPTDQVVSEEQVAANLEGDV